MAKVIENLVIHCTATPEGREVTADDIRRWHMSPKPVGRGWDRVGYSDMIMLDGSLVNLTNWDQDGLVESHEMTWGAAGVNSISQHIVYVGGMSADNTHPKNTLTKAQDYNLRIYVEFMLLRYPWIRVVGHNEFTPHKACPSFDVQEWYEHQYFVLE